MCAYGYNAHSNVWVAAIREELRECESRYRNMKDKYDVAMKRTAQWLDIRDENVFCLHVIGTKSHPYNYSVTPGYAHAHTLLTTSGVEYLEHSRFHLSNIFTSFGKLLPA